MSASRRTLRVWTRLQALRDLTDAPPEEVAAQRARGAAVLRRVLLSRRLLYRVSTGEPIDPRFGMLSYPVRWYYDVLRALDYFRVAGRRDARLADDEGRPRRWVSLRALRAASDTRRALARA